MVQKYQSPVRVYKYPFELVMAAYERRFPTCEMIPIIKETEILEEAVNDVTGIHMIDRRAKLNIDAPYLLKKFMGVEHLLFRQRNTLDRRERTLTIDAWNESFSNRVVITELCVYSVHPENPEWTCFEQSADLDIKNFFGFEGTAEKLAIKEYSKSIGKSKDIMEHYIGVLAGEGITSVPIWKPDPNAKLPLKAKNSDGSSDDPSRPLSPNKEEEKKEDSATNGAAKSLTEKQEKPAILRRKSSGLRGEVVEAVNKTKDDANTSNAKLEQDYIQMYLGELTPMQESKLVQLKSWVSELLKGKVPSDPVFLRFLRARDFNVEKAREMLSQSLIWRKKHGVDKILSEYEMPQVVKEYFPGGWYMHDKEDRPVFVLRLGVFDVKGIIKSVGEEGLTKLTLHVCEEGLRLTEEASHRLNRPISTWCLLLDLEGLNMRHLWRPGMKALLHIIEICEANYPETLGRVLIIRAPRVFPIMWTLVSPLIDETSRAKFLFYGGNDYQGPGGLVDYIDPSLIPDWLGGPRATEIPQGGLVPKSYYMSVEEFEKDQSPGPHLMEDSFYNSASIGKGQVHEGIIHNSDKGSVITWDFDVMRHDVVFTVYRLRIPLPIKSPQVSPTPTAGQSTTFTFPSVGKESKAAATSVTEGTASDADKSSRNNTPLGYAETSSEHKSVLLKQGGREGHDYYKVEASIVCHDGESIQGSHVTSHVGTYVLQWRFFDKHSSHHSHNPLDVIDSLTTVQHKAKVMYYYETLSSVDYRGSMTSLQSCQSAFSNVSKVSKHSTSGISSGVSSSHSERLSSIPTVTILPPPPPTTSSSTTLSSQLKAATLDSSGSTSKNQSSTVISECGSSVQSSEEKKKKGTRKSSS